MKSLRRRRHAPDSPPRNDQLGTGTPRPDIDTTPDTTQTPAPEGVSGQTAQAVVRPDPINPGLALVLAGKLMLAPDGCPVGSCVHCGEPAIATGDGFRFKHAHLTHALGSDLAETAVSRRFTLTPGSQYCDPHNLASTSMKSGKDVRDPQLIGFDRGNSAEPTSPGLRWARDLTSGDSIVWGNKVETVAEIELVLGSLRLCFTSGKIADFSVDAHDVLYRVPEPDEVSAWDHQWKDSGAWSPASTPIIPGRDTWSGVRFLSAYVAKTLLHKCVYADDPDVLKRLVATEAFGTVWDLSAQRALHWDW